MPTNFKFLQPNQVNTTTQFTVDTNASSVVNLFDRDTTTSWISSNYSGATATTITWTPNTTSVAISRIYIQNCNFGQFVIYYDGTTTNAFIPTISASSATADDMYFEFATQTVATVHIKVTTTYPLSTEKSFAELYIGNEYKEFTRNPSADNYNPISYRKGQDFEMSDGGMVSVFLKQKFRADMSLVNISDSDISTYRTIYNTHLPFVFIPWPHNNIYVTGTSTTWLGAAYEVNWLGDFDALKVTDDYLGNGYDLNISLGETPN